MVSEAPRRDGDARRVGPLVTAACIVQSAHMVEHIAQATQHVVLLIAPAHGFLGAVFDLEWVHFAFNMSLELALVAALLLARRAHGRRAVPALGIAVGVQGYHAVEHVVKMM